MTVKLKSKSALDPNCFLRETFMKSLLLFAIVGLSSLGFAQVLPLSLSGANVQAPKSNKLLSCTSFTGSWEGTCVTEESTLSQSVTINQNGCDSIALDGDEFPFGVDLVAENETSRYTNRLDWDSNNKVIEVNAKLESKESNEPSTSFKTDVTVKGSLEIVGQELISTIKNSFSPRAGETPSATTEICRYKRK